MQQTAVIGDIHGCLSSLNSLLNLVLPKAQTLIFLGDYVDRGPDSRGVVEKILELKKKIPRVITLRGNHDYLFQQFLDGRDQQFFLAVGGHETLRSYGIEENDPNPAASIPKSHLNYFRELILHHEDQFGIYVHAGLQPGIHLSMQSPEWCLWAREEFLGSRFNLGKPIIFGHTAFPKPFCAEDKIGIDTGAVYGGKLTALLLPEMRFISVPGEREKPYIHPQRSFHGK